MLWPHITNIVMVFPEFKDIFREDTIKSYKEWLRMEGRLDDISNITSFPKCQINCYQLFANVYGLYILDVGAYDNHMPHQDLTNSSQDGNPTPPLQRPCHAGRQTQGNGK